MSSKKTSQTEMVDDEIRWHRTNALQAMCNRDYKTVLWENTTIIKALNGRKKKRSKKQMNDWLISSLHNCAVAREKKGRIKQAIKYRKEEIQVIKKSSFKMSKKKKQELLSKTYNYLGTDYMIIGNFEKSFECIKKGMQIIFHEIPRLKNKRKQELLIIPYSSLALLYEKMRDFQQMLTTRKKELTCLKHLKNKENKNEITKKIGYCFSKLGKAEEKLGNYKNMFKYYCKSIFNLGKLKNCKNELNVQYSIAYAWGLASKAIHEYNKINELDNYHLQIAFKRKEIEAFEGIYRLGENGFNQGRIYWDVIKKLGISYQISSMLEEKVGEYEKAKELTQKGLFLFSELKKKRGYIPQIPEFVDQSLELFRDRLSKFFVKKLIN